MLSFSNIDAFEKEYVGYNEYDERGEQETKLFVPFSEKEKVANDISFILNNNI